MHKIFRYPNFLKFWSDVREIFRHCETIIIRRKNVTPPPPLSSIKLFETRIFLKNSRIPLRNFSALGDIKNSTENRDTPSPKFFGTFRYSLLLSPPPLIHIFFRYQNFSDTQIRRFPYEIFQHWDKKKFRNKIVR